MNLREKIEGNRTLLYEGDQHVATIMELQKPDKKTKQGLYHWIVPSMSDHAGTYHEAYNTTP